MSFSVSGTFAVLILGVLVAVGMVYPAIADGYLEVSDARAENVNDLRDRQNTAVDVVDPVLDLANGVGTVRFDAYNNGSTTLHVNRTDVIIDGEYIVDVDTVEVCTGTGGSSCSANRYVWEPGERLHVEETRSAYFTDNPEHVKLVTEHDASDSAGIEVL